jgi:dTDP-4-dehydrorhamnose reductase
VGTALLRRLPDVIAPSRTEFDLAELNQGRLRGLIDDVKPDAIINCAAYTAVDESEERPDHANLVNGHAVGWLAATAAELGIPLVTYSTDYVFDGQAKQAYVESSSPKPLNAYGRSKLLGEQLAFQANPDTLVIRTSWVISATHPNFVSKVLFNTRKGRPVRVVEDQCGSPTIASDLAASTQEALEREATGLLHLTNQGSATWFDLATTAAELAGIDPHLITACTTAEYPTRAPRPRYSVLGSERLMSLGLTSLPHWRLALPSVITDLSGRDC